MAAVNYYFRDKLGLYQQVLMKAIECMDEVAKSAHEAKPGVSAEERFGHYVRTFMGQVLSNGRACRAGKLMAREMADPSPAFDLIIEKAIRPNSVQVATLVSELTGLPPADPDFRSRIQAPRRLGDVMAGDGHNLSEIHFESSDRLTLYPTAYPIALHMGSGNWESKLRRLDRILTLWKGHEHRLASLDVSFRDQVVARLRKVRQ